MAERRNIRKIKQTRLWHEIMEEGPRVSSVQPLVQEAELVSSSDLPNELLENILSRLNLSDNIRASAVCRRWKTVATSVRVEDKALWLMFPPRSGHDTYEFFDPCRQQRYFFEFPELRHSRFSYAKDSWLLMSNYKTTCVFFFCPYTREVIELPIPNLTLVGQQVAFSTSPKCSSCIVFTITNVCPTIVAISTCGPRVSQWTTVNFPTMHQFSIDICSKIVFSKDQFYCLSVSGLVGVYSLEKNTWDVLSVSPPRFTERSSVYGLGFLGKYLAEHSEDIYFVHTFGENPVIFKLDLANGVWVEIGSLGGITLFLNFSCSHARANLLRQMKNSIYFPEPHCHMRHSIMYSFDTGRYCPKNQRFDWERMHAYRSIWVDAPEDLSPFLQRLNP